MGRPSFRDLVAAVVIGIGWLGTIAAPSLAQGQRRTAAEDVPAFVLPDRTASAGTVEPPPELPSEAHYLTPSALEVHTTAAGHTAESVQTVTRTVDRVRVDMPGNREWLYVRNPVDARRVSAWLTDHAAKTIVVYDESDLRQTMGIRGWLDVLTLGFDSGTLAHRTPVGEARRAFDLPFQHFTIPAADAAVQEVWWHQGQLLPLKIVRRRPAASSTVVTVRQRRLDVDLRRIASPATRFPHYRQLDFADWLEGLHER